MIWFQYNVQYLLQKSFRNQKVFFLNLLLTILECKCFLQKQLQVQILPKKKFYSPKEKIVIQMKGSQDQTIGLSLVDDAVHVISNRYRLTTDFVSMKKRVIIISGSL